VAAPQSTDRSSAELGISVETDGGVLAEGQEIGERPNIAAN